MNRKPASIGAIVMLAGGLMVYWALSQWKLFGLGQQSTSGKPGNAGPPSIDDSTNVPAPGFGGGSSSGGGGGGSSF